MRKLPQLSRFTHAVCVSLKTGTEISKQERPRFSVALEHPLLHASIENIVLKHLNHNTFHFQRVSHPLIQTFGNS